MPRRPKSRKKELGKPAGGETNRKKNELKRKTEDEEALGRVQKARKELEREVTDLKSVVTSLQQPVRGSVQYYAHKNAALKIKRAEDVKKYEESDKKAKNQAKAHKEQIKQLEDNFKKQMLQSKHNSGLPRRSTVKLRRKFW